MSEETIKAETVNKRDDTLDIMKGICILFVVLGHTYTPILSNFVYLFHVAVFFMVSGYCFNGKYLESWEGIKSLFKKRIISLWVPYVSWNFVFLLLQNGFLKVGLLTDNPHYFDLNPVTNYGFIKYLPLSSFPKTILKSFLFMNCRPFVGGLWFLGGLFFVTTAYCVIEYILKKIRLEKFHLMVSIILLCIGYFINKKGFFADFGLTKQIVIILETEILFAMGYSIKKWKFIPDLSLKKLIFLVAITLISLTVLMFFGSISVASNIITNPLYFIVVSLLGWYFVWSVSKLINLCSIKKFFLICGNKTIPILALHTLSFKLVIFIQTFFLQEKDFVVLSLFPVFKNSIGWTCLYLIVGVGFPLLLSFWLGRYKLMNKLFRF